MNMRLTNLLLLLSLLFPAALIAQDSVAVFRKQSDQLPTSAQQLRESIHHNYAKRIEAFPDVRSYLKSGRHPSMTSIAGFQEEINAVGTRTKGSGGWQLATRNDPVADLVKESPDGTKVRLQVYSGKSVATAVEKWLGSDAEADFLRIPRDMHDTLASRLDYAVEVWSDESRTVENRGDDINRRLRGTGLRIDEDGVIHFRLKEVGHVDGLELKAARSRLMRAPRTSDQILTKTLVAKNYLTSTALQEFRKSLTPGEKRSLEALRKRLQESRLSRFEQRLGNRNKAAELSRRSALRSLERMRKQGQELGLQEHEILKALKDGELRDQSNVSARRQNASHRKAIQDAAIRKHSASGTHRVGTASVAGISGAFMLATGLRQWIESGLSFEDWVASDAGTSWMTGAGVGIGVEGTARLTAQLAQKFPVFAKTTGRLIPFAPIAFVAAAILADTFMNGRPVLDSLATHSIDAVCAVVVTVGCFMGPAGWLVSGAVLGFQLGMAAYDWFEDAEVEVAQARFENLAQWLQDTELSKWSNELKTVYGAR